jgi:CHAT domain-containing protein/tetratricopeptide (TPR) repeat protein
MSRLRSWRGIMIVQGCVLLGAALVYADERAEEYTALRLTMGGGKYAESIARCQQLIERYPDYLVLYETLAEVCQYTGQLDLAREFMEDRIRAGKHVKEAYFGLASVMYTQRDFCSARDNFARSIEYGLHSPECYKLWEYSIERTTTVKDAIHFFSTMSCKEPANPYNWYALSLAFWTKGDFAGVENSIRESLEISPAEARFEQLNVGFRYQMSQPKPGSNHGMRALAKAMADADYDGLLFLYSSMIIGLFQSEVLDSASALVDSVVSISRRFGFVRWEAWGSKSRADLLYFRDDYEGSLRVCRSARSKARRVDDYYLESGLLACEFWSLFEMSAFDEAASVGSERVQLAKTTNAEIDLIVCRGDLAQLYFERGDYDIALQYAVAALSTPDVLNAHRDEWLRSNIVVNQIQIERGNSKLALGNLLQMLPALAKEGYSGRQKAIVHGIIGNIYLHHGDPEQARLHFKRQLRFAQKAKFLREESSALNNLAAYWSHRKCDSVAAGLYRASLSISRPLKLKSLSFASLQGLGEVSERQKRFGAAIEYYENALAVLHTMGLFEHSLSVTSPGIRAYRRAYSDLVRSNYSLGRLEEAFRWCEEEKLRLGRTMISLSLRELEETSDDPNRKELIHAAKSLEFSTARLSRVAGGGESAEEQEAQHEILTEIAKKELEYRRIVSRLGKDDPLLQDVLNEEPVAMSALQQRVLGSNEGLLEWMIGENQTFIFFITRDTSGCFQIEQSRDSLQNLIGEVSSLFTGRIGGESRKSHLLATKFEDAALSNLYDVMIGPTASALKSVTKLVVVPDDFLLGFPLELLINSEASRDIHHRFGGSYFVETMDMSYSFSASMLARRPCPKSNYSHSFLAFGDPRIVGPAAMSRDEGSLLSGEEGTAFFAPLPGAANEVEQIKKVLPFVTQVYVQRQATKERFLSEAPSYSLLHLAVHASQNEMNPMLAAFHFASEGQGRASGTFFAYELLNMNLSADLVVLSSCYSGWSGKPFARAGLVHGFLAAGARSVVSSLWDVEDGAATELMIRFYKHLIRGESKSRALRLAKLELLASRETDPTLWAPFILVGDDSPLGTGNSIPDTTGHAWGELILLGAPLLFASALFVSTLFGRKVQRASRCSNVSTCGGTIGIFGSFKQYCERRQRE